MTRAPALSRIPETPFGRATAHYRSTPFIRSAVAALLAHREKVSTAEIVERHWPRDEDTALLTRASVTPHSSSTTTAFNSTAVADFIGGMTTTSAMAALLSRCPRFEFGRDAKVRVPSSSASADNASWITPGSAIPVRAEVIEDVELSPNKLASIRVYSNELLTASTANVEAYLRASLTSSISLTMDVAGFDDQAATASRPAGLRLGIAAKTASTADDPQTAMREDVATLVSSARAVGGQSQVVLIASPAQAVALEQAPRMPYEVFSSAALSAGIVIAIATNCVAAAIDPTPRFEASDQGTLVLDDAAGALSVVGTPAVVSAPAVSLFQSDMTALRVILTVSWMLRNASGLAWTTVAW